MTNVEGNANSATAALEQALQQTTIGSSERLLATASAPRTAPQAAPQVSAYDRRVDAPTLQTVFATQVSKTPSPH